MNFEQEKFIWHGFGKEKQHVIKLSEAISNLQYWFNSLNEENQRIIEENKYLKSEHYKDAEMAKMAEDLKNMKEEVCRITKQAFLGFPITEEQNMLIQDWKIKHDEEIHKNTSHYHGVSGGGYIYEFYPTGIGTAGVCICETCRRKAYEAAIEKNGTYDSRKYRKYMKENNGEFTFQELG